MECNSCAACQWYADQDDLDGNAFTSYEQCRLANCYNYTVNFWLNNTVSGSGSFRNPRIQPLFKTVCKYGLRSMLPLQNIDFEQCEATYKDKTCSACLRNWELKGYATLLACQKVNCVVKDGPYALDPANIDCEADPTAVNLPVQTNTLLIGGGSYEKYGSGEE